MCHYLLHFLTKVASQQKLTLILTMQSSYPKSLNPNTRARSSISKTQSKSKSKAQSNPPKTIQKSDSEEHNDSEEKKDQTEWSCGCR